MKKIFLFIVLYIILNYFTFIHGKDNFKIYKVWSQKRQQLTIEYQKKHYGKPTHLLDKPQMIVIHYTELNSLNKTLRYFKNATLDKSRSEIIKGGKLNVGVHFVVDKDGTIYSLIPENFTGRHVIGFNYTAFGIENIAKNSKQLTKEQLNANILLVKYLKNKYKTIKYLIGHHEYSNKNLPHFKLYIALDKNYKFTIKRDPGKFFMNKLRNNLKLKHNIVLKK